MFAATPRLLTPQPPEAARQAARISALDGVRGLAIALVLFHQMTIFQQSPSLAGRLYEFLTGRGWIGVQLFFTLSGFLITSSLIALQDTRHRFRTFYVRRVLRIFPVYYATLAVTFLALPALGVVPASVAADAPDQVWLWTFLQNWVSPSGVASHTFAHFWSLAVEEQFYLIWPFVVFGRTPRSIMRWCVAIAIASLAARIALLQTGFTPDQVYTFSVCRMDALACGGWFAAWSSAQGSTGRSEGAARRHCAAGFALLGVGMLVSNFYARLTWNGQVWGYGFLAVGLAWLVLASTRRGAGDPLVWRLLSSRPLRALGTYSYAMYIFHLPIREFIMVPALHQLGLDRTSEFWVEGANMSAAFGLTLATGWLSYHLVEKHFLRLKQRLANPDT